MRIGSWEQGAKRLFRAEQGLRSTLFRNFFARFEVDYRYHRQPAPGRKNADIRYIASLGYEFSF